uniref:Active regulator of SIRT1 n=1 Tax=Sphenodon punctatus TaxID=8508 RepID=A0A8D0GZM2_SPHPU
MSASLLRKGLELLAEPAGAAHASHGSRQPLRKRPTKKVAVASGRGRDKATVKGKITKSALEVYQKHQAVNHLKKNLEYMMHGRFIADSTITQKVLSQNRGRKSRDRPAEEPQKKKSEGTVFTEEDFQRFEKEYFAATGPA